MMKDEFTHRPRRPGHFLLIAGVAGAAIAAALPAAAPAPSRPNANLLWSDEFDGTPQLSLRARQPC